MINLLRASGLLMPVTVILAALAAWAAGYGFGRIDGASRCHEKELAQKVSGLELQLQIFRQVSEEAGARAAKDAKEISDLREKANAYANSKPRKACDALDADDVRQLRAIR
jgi:hypothetical protein